MCGLVALHIDEVIFENIGAFHVLDFAALGVTLTLRLVYGNQAIEQFDIKRPER
ncbi:hypothetical protein P280DRAFT_470241 [Massarina eburnea CBS 473.64]|uniref:Uncharacterized protein n=1 Tax=Massarina eburnea CBS 473.64 TaxID=1395130 RepID=A0A6A6S089_9PLEO|nr:hypothetical protein P280DRAFT_470241 [Massarina eburnea CBS 473.64]